MVGSLSMPNPANEQELKNLFALSPQLDWQRLQWQQLSQTGVPGARDQDWLHTPISAIFTNPTRPSLAQPMDDLSYESLSLHTDAYRLVFFDGKLQETLSDSIPAVTITSMAALSAEQSEQLRRSVNADPLCWLIDGMATTGVYVEIAAEQALDKPLYLFHLNSGNQGEVCSYRHHVHLKAQANATIIEHHVSLDLGGGTSLARLTLAVDDRAECEHIKLVEEGENQQHFAHNDINVAANAQATSHVLMLAGRMTRHQTSSALLGSEADIAMNSLALPTDDQVVETRTYLQHQASHCESNQQHKLIGQGRSKSTFDGMILVSPDAIQTNGQMDNHNLLLSDEARVFCRPKLEIYADDVKCSHGATTGELNPEQLFYMQARGINETQARQMLIQAFARDVLDAVSLKAVRDHAWQRVSARLTPVSQD
uniref:Fe-S cluster assembly protein SufD n=1 Tax=Thaumasiovibrio occultus TaxID=1891184 RepID=UPI000B3607D5|nr:Fe-S cluster assembly protein SufD [Thaumasiovibrio occultus]